MQKFNIRFGLLVAMIVLAAFSRIIPHMPNFSPLSAIGLFGAAHFQKKWQAFLIPIAATWLSDLFINNIIYAQYYSEFTWFYQGFYWQYGSYLLITLLGFVLLRKISIGRIFMVASVSTVIFFLISNFGCWIGSATYPQNFSGLLACYTAGIPFLKGTFLGDLCYSIVLFGSFAIAQKQFSVILATQRQSS
ncbi:MAG TPA: hypothetical protein PK191_00540 [Niabella sp.]|nr:hypothetical protein [Niabella sp.]HOZ96589.1 hypothetical protein [Niabella sp.]HQW13230.1 hypothetical protein [Niabella sp.]HQX18730.1 hypothetical protein [Niabella sp.]HQX41616.1 hypothetical protein [Niabella sp.]